MTTSDKLTEQQAAEELVRLAEEQGVSLSGPDGLLEKVKKIATQERNKVIAQKAIREAFVDKDPESVARYFSDSYIQHNPAVPDGPDAMRGFIASIGNLTWEPHRVIAEGDYVMTHNRVGGLFDDTTKHIVADIYRLEDGKIVEHWDVLQEEVPADKTASGRPMV